MTIYDFARNYRDSFVRRILPVSYLIKVIKVLAVKSFRSLKTEKSMNHINCVGCNYL